MCTKKYVYLIALVLSVSGMISSCRNKEDKQELMPTVPKDTPDTNVVDTGTYDSICFSRDILPIFKSNCAIEACHDAITGQEGIVFDSYETFFYKGFVPGNASSSQVYNAITRTTSRRMPPITTYGLDSIQIRLIKKWIDQGMPENACKQKIDTTQFAFKSIVYPIIKNHCFGCHNDQSEHQNNVWLQTYEQIKMYALNGKLLGVITHQAGYKPMPDNGAKMDEVYIKLITKWIESGAPNN